MRDPSVESWRAIWIPRDHFAPEFEAFPTEAAAEAFAEQGVREGVAREFLIVAIEEQSEKAPNRPTTGPRSEFQPSGVVLGAGEGETP